MQRPRGRHAIALTLGVLVVASLIAWGFAAQTPDTATSTTQQDGGLRIMHTLANDGVESTFRPISPGQTLTFEHEVDTLNITKVSFTYTVRITGPNTQPRPFHTNITTPLGDSYENETAAEFLGGGGLGTTVAVGYGHTRFNEVPRADESHYPTYHEPTARTADAERHTTDNGTGTWTVRITYQGTPDATNLEVRTGLLIEHYHQSGSQRIEPEPTTDDAVDTESHGSTAHP